MSICPATTTDEPTMASICAAAFFEESLFAQVMHPKRHEYPEDFQIYWHDSMREKFLEPRNRILVYTIKENGKHKTVGHATWQRQGDDEPAKRIIEEWKSPGRNPFQPLARTHNRAADPSKADLLKDTFPFFQHYWSGTTNGVPNANNWYLDLLCVHPDYQGRGIASSLVRWGLDRAREEGVHASVTVSHMTEPFYLKTGFDEVVGDCKEGEGNPMAEAGVQGGAVMFMWAKKKENCP